MFNFVRLWRISYFTDLNMISSISSISSIAEVRHINLVISLRISDTKAPLVLTW